MSFVRSLLAGGVAAVAISAGAAEPGTEKTAPRAAAKVVERIDAVLKGEGGTGDAEALKAAAEEVLKAVPENVLVEETLAAAVEAGEAGRLREGLEKARVILAFEPTMEAPLPEGFPEPTPVGEIRVKEYPEYRIAKTPAGLGENVAFFTLFGHIQKNDIAMTAPVELTIGDEGEKPRAESMAFLYRSVRQGQEGKEGVVEVTDVPPGTAVAIGMRGDLRDERTAEARKRLEAWLKGHAEYEPAGPARVMGYNGPGVPTADRYFEVEIPVRKKGEEAAP